jgi:hypothetical protein
MKKPAIVIPLGLCPCGGKIAASMGPDRVGHSVPSCLEFQDLGPVEFLKYVLRVRGIPEKALPGKECDS